MNQTTKKVKAVDVGSFISEEYSNHLQQSFKEAYPGTETRFTFSKALMLKVLNLSNTITGIRFMYGLEDQSNPSSIKLILIPCTNATEYSQNSKPLIFSSGYYDNHGKLNSLKETSAHIVRFVQSMMQLNESLEYKRVTRGAFVGRNSLTALTEDKDCAHIALNFGLRDDIIEPVFEPLNSNLESHLGIYLEFVQACPPFCGPGTDDVCFAALAVELSAYDKREIMFYRKLRDRMLFSLRDGSRHYEMFHFISPIVSLLIPRMLDKDAILTNIYQKRLLPLKNLINEERFEEATEWIANGLDELVEEFEMTKTEGLLEEVA